MQVISEGSVRVDLVGGTLDLEPINLILPHVVTLNVATSLKAKVELSSLPTQVIEIQSKDYAKNYEFHFEELTEDNLYYNNYFKEMSFVLQVLSLFKFEHGLKVVMSSGAPAGSGLGGSSAMGMTLFKAMCELTGKSFSIQESVAQVKGVEGRILNQGIPGYQDYFPAMLGGVLALKGAAGRVDYEQLFSSDLKSFLEDHITLVYSGISRNSGINNWDVYKKFFDGVPQTRQGLSEIAKISHRTYQAIKEKNYEQILTLIGEEGEKRKSLAPNIVPNEVQFLFQNLKKDKLVKGLKMCGAGGGGCFILTHSAQTKAKLQEVLAEAKYKTLPFEIEKPL
jgi:D-glycero-alpha-D-manno-heptose-7-phosphate kinase